jgi:hypothetical protein
VTRRSNHPADDWQFPRCTSGGYLAAGRQIEQSAQRSRER